MQKSAKDAEDDPIFSIINAKDDSDIHIKIITAKVPSGENLFISL